MVGIFRTRNLLSRQISKTKPTNQLDFSAYRVEYFYNKLPYQIKIKIAWKKGQY